MQPSLSFWHLRDIELFDKIEPADVEKIVAMMTHSHLKKGDVIYSEGDVLNRIFLLKQGRIKISHNGDGTDETITELLEEGDLFGKLAITNMEEDNSETAVIVSESAMVCSLRTEDLELMMQTKPQLAINYANLMGQKLRMIENKFALFLKKDIRKRLVNFFLMHALHEGKQKGKMIEIQGFLTHKDIANFIGTSRQTVTTFLNEMEVAEVIEFIGDKKIIIRDLEKLKNF